jgi:hypothetical protein
MVSTRIDFDPLSPVKLVKPNGQVFGFGFGATTDVARGTALSRSVSAAVSGDIIEAGRGTFDLGSGRIILPAGAKLRGAGKQATYIISTADLNAAGPIVTLNDDTIVSDLSVTAPISDGATYQACFGVINGHCSNARLERVSGTGDSDCFYFQAANAATISVTSVDSDYQGKWDAGFVGTTPGGTAANINLDLQRSSFISIGGGTLSPTLSRGLCCAEGAMTVTATDCKFSATCLDDVDGEAQALATEATHGKTVTVTNSRFTSVCANSAVDILGIDPISVSPDCIFDSTKASNVTLLKFAGVPPTAAGLALLSGASASAQRSSLGLVIGTDVLAPSGSGASLTALNGSNISSGTVAAARMAAATTSAQGAAELATSTEINTGTDTGRVLDVSDFTHSNYGKRFVTILIPGTLATGDAQVPPLRIPSEWNGWNLVGMSACVRVASSSGLPTFQIRRVRSATPSDMLSTKVSIDASEVDSSTAATAAVIDTSNDDVNTGDQIYIDCDVAGTGAVDVTIQLVFQLP